MQSKNNKSKTTQAVSKKADEQTTVLTQAPVVSVENANKIVEDKLQGQVVEVKKGGARTKTASKTTDVQPVQTVQVVQVEPAVQTTGTKSKKTTKVAQVAQVEPAVAQVEPVVAQVEPVVVQVAGSKSKKAKTSVQAGQSAQPAQLAAPVAPVAEVAQVETVAQPDVQVAGVKTKKAPKVKTQKVQKVKKVQKVEVEQEDVDGDGEEEQVGGKLRYFKLYYNNENKGRYCGKKPKQAANKAFSSIIKELNSNGQNEGINVDINYSITECTRHSKHKEYKYTGKRLALEEPVPVYILHDGEVSADNIKEEKLVSNIAIKQKKVETIHSGREVTTNGGSIYLLSNNGSTFKKIIYHYHNKIQKAPKVVPALVPVA